MQPGQELTPSQRMQAAASVGLYARWRVACDHWKAEPYRRGSDDERRRACGAAIADNIHALGGLAAVW